MTRMLTLALALTAIACGGSTEPADGDEAAPPAVALATPAGLASLLPDLDGWDRAEVESAALELPVPAAHAATTYTRDDARVDMEITDTGGQAEYLEATMKIAGTDFDRTTDNGYFRGAMVGGAPAIESWNHVDRLAELTAVVANRFVVHATGSGLDGIEALRAMVEHVSFERLAALTPR